MKFLPKWRKKTEPFSFFGTDGIRGSANQGVLRPEYLVILGRVLALILQSQGKKLRIAIARDTRVSGDMLFSSLVSGFLSEGGDVFDFGIIPTPAVSFFTLREKFPLGVMITASHNPFGDNGIKIFDSQGDKIDSALIAKIENLWKKIMASKPREENFSISGKIHNCSNILSLYTNFLKTTIKKNPPDIKVVLDCANGATYQIAPQVFVSLGIEVSVIGNQPDGENINLNCGSLFPERVFKKVQEEKADLGISFDGDGDRVVISTAQRILKGDEMIYLCALDLFKKGELKENKIVLTETSNMGLLASLKKEGILFEITEVGDHMVARKMKEMGISFGGETSGHLTFSHYLPTGDGILAAIQIISRFEKSTWENISEALKGLNLYPQVTKDIIVRKKIPFSKLPELFSVIKSTRQFLGEEGRFLVRYSGTEPKIRILAEHISEKKAAKAVKNVSEIVKKILV